MSVDRGTGELLPVDYVPATLEDAGEMFALAERAKRECLVAGIDYGAVPGTDGRPVLLAPGANKLVRIFNLAHHFDHPRERGDLGVYSRCSLTWLQTGAVVGEADAYAGYDEPAFWKGRGDQATRQPWNRLLRMAEKRALVAVVRDVTCSRSLFSGADEPAGDGEGEPRPYRPRGR